MKTTKRLGRRGGSLLIYGLIFFLSGLPLLVANPPSPVHVAFLRFWAAAFVAAGAVAAVSAFRRTPRGDKVGFVALTLVGTAWAVYAFLATVAGHYLDFPHSAGLIVSAVTTSLLVVKINIDAGWNEPPHPVLTDREDL